ncbi:MAG: ribulose-phosphate 3-epimerase [Nitrospirae bacterium]|jgi:ribulose-phosphate 3-epimerase|nr:ribulose-phosphate 3-epimerase [Nitrospirota bacterium]MBS1232518.1 ribulose-phosphate 3-epimerase [Nitrospirota bacterium]
MIKIAPSILSANFLSLGEEIKAAETAGADMLHIDIMDGHFVPNITIGPSIVEALRTITSLPLDVHLMIEKPDVYVGDFIKAGADYLTIHYEASVHLHRTVQLIKEHGAKAGVSLNPSTPVWSLEDILPDIDMVLLMSVNPGFGGQEFIPQVIHKIKMLKKLIREKGLSPAIEVDGGVKLDNTPDIIAAGADILVMGSAFFGAGDYTTVVRKFREITQHR